MIISIIIYIFKVSKTVIYIDTNERYIFRQANFFCLIID